MKNLFRLFGFLYFFSGCAAKRDVVVPLQEKKPTKVICFCSINLQDTINILKMEYSGNQLKSKTSYINNVLVSKTYFEYNSNNMIVLETTNGLMEVWEKRYNYNNINQLVLIKETIINLDSNGLIQTKSEGESSKEYLNNLLTKEKDYWGTWRTFEYENQKLVKKIDYTPDGQQHHITTYSYQGNLLSIEKKQTVHGSLIYEKKYLYDSQNRVLKILDQNSIIEENLYLGSELLEKKIYYHGIDPGYFMCNGNYVYKFSYD